jgi:PIN domain nuclease of toxin-antitoxin system
MQHRRQQLTQRKLRVRLQLKLVHKQPQARVQWQQAQHKQQQLMQPKLQVRLPPKRVRKLQLQPQAQL